MPGNGLRNYARLPQETLNGINLLGLRLVHWGLKKQEMRSKLLPAASKFNTCSPPSSDTAK